MTEIVLDEDAVEAAVVGYDEARCRMNAVWHGMSCQPMSDVNRKNIKPMIAEAIRAYLAAEAAKGIVRHQLQPAVTAPKDGTRIKAIVETELVMEKYEPAGLQALQDRSR